MSTPLAFDDGPRGARSSLGGRCPSPEVTSGRMRSPAGRGERRRAGPPSGGTQAGQGEARPAGNGSPVSEESHRDRLAIGGDPVRWQPVPSAEVAWALTLSFSTFLRRIS